MAHRMIFFCIPKNLTFSRYSKYVYLKGDTIFPKHHSWYLSENFEGVADMHHPPYDSSIVGSAESWSMVNAEPQNRWIIGILNKVISLGIRLNMDSPYWNTCGYFGFWVFIISPYESRNILGQGLRLSNPIMRMGLEPSILFDREGIGFLR